MTALIELKNICKDYITQDNFGRKKKLTALTDVNLSLTKGQTLGLVGESGSGKTTLASILLRLESATSGQIIFDGTDITHLSESKLLPYRRRMQYIFQDPYSSLDPRMNIEEIITEPLIISGMESSAERRKIVLRLLDKIGLEVSILSRYPHEFSGGQRQRISIARALTTNAEILILDEPTSALDVSVQAQVLNLLVGLQQELKLTYLFISHNLSVVKYISQEIAVLHSGKIAESGPTDKILKAPQDKYTRELLAAVPVVGRRL